MRFPRLVLIALTTSLAPVVFGAIAPEKLSAIREQIRERKLVEANAAARALLVTNPSEPEAYGLLGSVQIAEGDPDSAIPEFEKAVELAPNSSELWRQLGDAYGFAAQKAGMLSKISLARKCRAAYERAVELDPGNLAARSSLMTYYQSAPGVMGGGLDKAFAQAAEIKARDLDRGRVAYATLYAADHRYAEAFDELEEVLRANPDSYRAWFQLGRLSALSGDRVDRGMELLRKCLAVEPPAGAQGHDVVHWRLGNLWERRGNKKAARAEYDAALKVNPNFEQAKESLKTLDR
jgi:tetratricopeptide (TPR) repeat protein